MLSLESPRWSELKHAYGNASNIPALLRQLDSLPPSHGNSEPWFSLWSSLAHQGDVYSASFAAVPHVIHAFASAPLKAAFTYLHFPAWVEICRARKHITVPTDLRTAYFDALEQIPSLVSIAAGRTWDSDFLRCVLAAIAAAKGQPAVAEAALELTPEVSSEFLEWYSYR